MYCALCHHKLVFAAPAVCETGCRHKCEPCETCEEDVKPSHRGSRNCQSGSVNSGGKESHCSCDTCF